jgi:uncharacterized damage-inducible protein DinB
VTSAELLLDGFGRIREEVRSTLDGLTPEQLSTRIDGKSNSIAWLVWHLTRVQDDHVADAAEIDQVWTTLGWVERFGLSLGRKETGYGHGDAEVAAVTVKDGALLRDYHEAVYEQTIAYVRSLSEDDLARVVDKRWDPPVTLAVRLVSVISDDLQHIGQAAFVRGLLES